MDDRICEYCGDEYRPRSERQRYCGNPCTASRSTRNGTCAVCGVPVFIAPIKDALPQGEAKCHECKVATTERREVESTCGWCGTSILDSKPRKYCDLACHRRAHLAELGHDPEASPAELGKLRSRRSNRRRRALKKGVRSEPYTTESVGERDGWRCGLCSGRVGRSYAYPHPRSAVVDHIVPLALGGNDLLSNVQIAHHHCNSVKGARAANSQLRLIG